MAFNFGNTTAPALGQTSTQAKPASGFGSFSFGTQQPTSAPAFGATAATSAAPSFGTTPAFGSTGFGATTSAPTLGGFGGFGSTTTAAPSLFGGIGSAPTSTGFSGFGTGTTTSSAPSFGGFGSSIPSTGFGGFSSNFGSTFGKPLTAAATSFGGFGSGFGLQQQPQQQVSQQLNPEEAFGQSLFNVAIFGDERDTIIAKWNYLQAMWGSGKCFYSQGAAPIDITPQNYLCRFKTIAFTRLPGKENKAGLVALIINKPIADVRNQEQNIIASLAQIFGNKPNLIVHIDGIHQQDDKTKVVIYIEEKSFQSASETKRILATDVGNYLNQTTVKPQLTNLGVEQVLPLVLPDEDQLKQYLENPPKGIDPRMWSQAKLDNPNPQNFIPVPVIGFNELKNRITCQENETETHVQYLAKVENDLAELKRRHLTSQSKILEYKRRLAEINRIILNIVLKQECSRKVGLAMTPEEEGLRSKLEQMQSFMSAPTQFKGRLSELLSQLRMQKYQYGSLNNEYKLDKYAADEMKNFLIMQQKSLEVVNEILNKDIKAVKIITDGLSQLNT